jgi:hypothetical protein
MPSSMKKAALAKRLRSTRRQTPIKLVAIAPAPASIPFGTAVPIQSEIKSLDKMSQKASTARSKASPKKTDTRERPWACLLCEKRYLSRATLRKHIIQCHEKGKPKCEYCSTEIRVDNMARHHHKHCSALKEVLRQQEEEMAKQAALLADMAIQDAIKQHKEADWEAYLAQEAIRIVTPEHINNLDLTMTDNDLDLFMNFVKQA